MKILRNILIAGAVAQIAAVALVRGDNPADPDSGFETAVEVIHRDAQMVISAAPGTNRHHARVASVPVQQIALQTFEPEGHGIIEPPETSGSERGFDRFLETGAYRTAWREGREHEYSFSAGDWHVRYTALFDTIGATASMERSGDGIKQAIMLAGPDAPDTLAWKIETNAGVTELDGGLTFESEEGEPVFMTPPPLASDAAGTPVELSSEFDPVTMIYRIVVNTAEIPEWPLTVDPSTVLASHAAGSAYVYNVPEYTVARNQTVGYTSSSLITVGQRDDGYHDGYRHYSVYRGYLSFPAPEMIDALSCTLFVDGYDNYSEADFDIRVFGAEAYGPALDGGDFRRFDGWRSSGTYTGAPLAYSWSTASWSAGWNAIIFNAAGLDSLLAASGDTIRIALLSHEDVIQSMPSPDAESNEELVRFNISGTPPYLSISYVAPGPPLTPVALSVTDAGPDWIDAIVTTADAYADSILWYIGGVLDGATAYPDTSRRFDGLTPASAYQLQAAAKNEYGSSSLTSAVQASTPPRTPRIALVNALSPHSLRFAVDPLDNPAWVEFAIQDSLSGKYVDSEAMPDTLRDGPPDDWGWRNFGEWGGAAGDSLDGLIPDSLYVLRAKARW